MSNEVNYGFHYYDPIALSLINSFWEQPQYSAPEIGHHNYYSPRFAPYNTAQRSYNQSYVPSYEYYYDQNAYYHPQFIQPAGPTIYPEPQVIEQPLISPITYSEPQITASESFYSVDSYTSNSSNITNSNPEFQNAQTSISESAVSIDSHASNNTTITIVDTPSTELFKIEIPDSTENLVPIDDQVLKECLDIIDITADTPPKPKQPSNPVVPDSTKEITRKYTCTACKKFFINRPGLRKHFRTKVHQKEVADKGIADPINDPTSWVLGEHKCFICGKAFAKYTDMIDHVVNH